MTDETTTQLQAIVARLDEVLRNMNAVDIREGGAE